MIMRKKTIAFRWLCQRTEYNEELRVTRRNKCQEQKRIYERTIKIEKNKSCKQYCNVTTLTNPWNEAYKLALGKTQNTLTLTTLKKSDGFITTNIRETIQYMLHTLIPEDDEKDNKHLKEIIRLINELHRNKDDRPFTQNEKKE